MSTRPAAPTPQTAPPSARRVRYFWIAQAGALLCLVGFAGAALLIGPFAFFGFEYAPVACLLFGLPLLGALAAVVCSFPPVVPKARGIAAVYGVLALIALLVFSSNIWDKHRAAQADVLVSTPDWSEFESALDPWPFPVPSAALLAIGNACLVDRVPPLDLFIRVARGSDAHPTLLTLVAALCGADHTRWALAHGGSVVPKHDLAPSPLAFARDDRVFAMLRAAGASVEQRDPRSPAIRRRCCMRTMPPRFAACTKPAQTCSRVMRMATPRCITFNGSTAACGACTSRRRSSVYRACSSCSTSG